MLQRYSHGGKAMGMQRSSNADEAVEMHGSTHEVKAVGIQ